MFSHPWSFNSLEEELNNETSLFFTATEDNAVVGYIGMSVVVDEGYIFNVAVDGTHRNRGIGSALVETLVTYAKKITFAFSLLRFVKVTGMPVLSMKIRIYQGGREEKLLLLSNRKRCFNDTLFLTYICNKTL